MAQTKLLLFGGTFDPPHNGHISLLHHAIEAVQPSRVVVMPTGVPPHKAAGHTPAALRLEMCRCFLPLHPAVELSSMELVRKGKSYTIDTVQALQARYPEAHIFLPMGSDMLLYFRKWKSWQLLAQCTTLVVLCRAKADTCALRACIQELRQEGAHIWLVPGEITELSSSEIRSKAQQGEDISALVPPQVYRTIVSCGLYSVNAGRKTEKTSPINQ